MRVRRFLLLFLLNCIRKSYNLYSEYSVFPKHLTLKYYTVFVILVSMMQLPEYVQQLRRTVRLLNLDKDRYQRAHAVQKQKAEEFEKENGRLRKENEALQKEKQKLIEQLEKIKQKRDTYKNLTFKPKRKRTSPFTTVSGRKRCGQKGHKGDGRQKPTNPNETIGAFLTNGPHCNAPVSRVHAFAEHTVVDVPHWTVIQPTTIRYEIERQWCGNCHKEVHALPFGVLPFARLGINLFSMVMVWHYRFFDPLGKIAER